MRADRLPQGLGGVEPDRIEPRLVLRVAAGTGLEPDLGNAERARDQPLLDADVLDAVEGDGAVLAREDTAFDRDLVRSEEHTSELQSLMRISYAVFCSKQKTHNPTTYNNTHTRTKRPK